MTVLGVIDLNARQEADGSSQVARQRSNRKQSSLHEFEIDHDEDDTEANKRTTANAKDDDDDDDEHSESQPLTAAGRLQNARGRRSLVAGTLLDIDDDNQKASAKAAKLKRRRRSSARFLRLANVSEEENDGFVSNSAELGQMYNQVIRMHAENKINSNNSWGLKLIENLDKLLADDSIGSSETDSSQRSNSRAEPTKKGFNFTKASCTLDASTKIYSYRVDDVHLTSYRVLANLNRSDNASRKGAEETAATSQSIKKQSERRGVTETLESNFANINMNKLESAFDIDPLFHKMSKKFDEGGAKGLLLANLGVATNSCGIVFDSKEDGTPLLSRAAATENRKSTTETVSNNDRPATTIDLSSLTSKLHSLLDGDSIQDVPLVPQLALLRDDHNKLDAEGYVNKLIPTQKVSLVARSKVHPPTSSFQ
jgi:condensin complex subunit 2